MPPMKRASLKRGNEREREIENKNFTLEEKIIEKGNAENYIRIKI
jgi:hypothetical protein